MNIEGEYTRRHNLKNALTNLNEAFKINIKLCQRK